VSQKTVRFGLGLMAGAAAAAVYSWRVRPWFLRWGAQRDDLEPNWRAHELSPSPETAAVRAITIHAPASEVWPWLLQIGQDRGGFYSYAWLENLVGCEMRNAGRVIASYQHREVGDTVWLAPPDSFDNGGRMTIAHLDPEQAMVLMTPEDAKSVASGGESAHGFWAFEVHPVGEQTCRLVMRSSNGSLPTRAEIAAQRLFWEPMHFVMERKMMLTIKRLAERQRWTVLADEGGR